jgi:predicted alpha/beta superfamily hydrolase
MKKIVLCICMCIAITVHAQYKVMFVIKTLPEKNLLDTVFLAGSFNEWNPANEAYVFQKKENTTQLQVLLQPGNYEFKCTRGNWKKVETTNIGEDIADRFISISSDTVIALDIEGWADYFAQLPKKHTASVNVSILTDSFYMPQLNRSRRIWLYLPQGYATGHGRYPVLYMQDGQNLFDEKTAPFGELGLDECMDSLSAKVPLPCIVVGIDNGGDKRMTEYNPYRFRDFGDGEGDKYVDFIVHTLKPYIDKHYRTLTGKENTCISGSSMAGLITTYAVLKYPDVFGGAGIFSPAYWTAPQFDTFIDSLPGKISARLFLYAGAQESAEMVPDMERIADKLALKSEYFIYTVVDPVGRHNERSWRRWLPVFYQWMYNNKAE